MKERTLLGFQIEGLESRRLLAGGYLDPSFSSDGLTIASQTGFTFSAVDVAVRSDRKTIVAATAFSSAAHANFIRVARFNFDGTLDTTFGVNGITSARIPGIAKAVALQTDNKIVVLGTSGNTFQVVRFSANGAIDKTFGFTKQGIAGTSFGQGAVIASDIAIQKDGKIVAVGSADSGGNFDVAVARYTPDGLPDIFFNGSGQTIIGLGSDERGYGVAIDYAGASGSNPDYGKIVIVGSALTGNVTNMMFVRLKRSGTLDPSFHQTGKFSAPFLPNYHYSAAQAVVIQSNNKIAVAASVGPTSSSSYNFGVLRLNSDGSSDTSFGPSNSHTEIDFGGNDAARSVAISKSGDLLVGGSAGSNVGIVALKSNGIIDKAFGANGTGRVTTPGTSGKIFAAGLAISPGGTFVVAGGDKFATERYFDRAPYTATIYAFTPNAYEAGKVPAEFDIIITPNTSATTRVFYTASGTATSPFSILRNGIDYTGINPAPPPVIGTGGTNSFPHLFSGYVDIPAGKGFVPIFITPIDDSRPEANETVTLTLALDLGYDVNPAGPSATAVIHDNDTPMAAVPLTAATSPAANLFSNRRPIVDAIGNMLFEVT